MNPERIRLGVSACLLGEQVRYDGAHKRDSYIVETLGPWFDLVPICPETAIGLGVPREPVRLEGDVSRPRAVGVSNKTLDVTDPLRAYGRTKAEELRGISGYIFKSRSPSCGLRGVPVFDGAGEDKKGRGLFAQEIVTANPLLPVAEERCLADEETRDDFLERVYAYRRCQELQANPFGKRKLLEFHGAHKLILMSHSPEAYRDLGRLAATAETPTAASAECYVREFMKALFHRATRGKHANVMHHLMGYLKKSLDSGDKSELVEIIERYRRGTLPRAAPLTLLRHHFRHHPHTYVSQQLYLYPPPEERELRGL